MYVSMCVHACTCSLSSAVPLSPICRMSFDDFKREFSDLEVCNVTLDSFDEDESSECTPANACITADDKHADTEMCAGLVW